MPFELVRAENEFEAGLLGQRFESQRQLSGGNVEVFAARGMAGGADQGYYNGCYV
ncbi:MAG: hypothetical protein ACREU6_02830 [Steroidobacteraceae bacterium]